MDEVKQYTKKNTCTQGNREKGGKKKRRRRERRKAGRWVLPGGGGRSRGRRGGWCSLEIYCTNSQDFETKTKSVPAQILLPDDIPGSWAASREIYGPGLCCSRNIKRAGRVHLTTRRPDHFTLGRTRRDGGGTVTSYFFMYILHQITRLIDMGFENMQMFW